MTVAIAAMVVALTGCNTTTATLTSPNGTVQSISNTRSAWSSESYDWGVDTNGCWHARASKSGPDAATVAAFSQLITTVGMMKP